MMRCCGIFALLLTAATSVLAHPTHSDTTVCNITQGMKSAINCWLDSKDGKWLTGPDVLDMQEQLRNADWKKVYEVGKTTKNLTLVGDALLGDPTALKGMALSMGLMMDDAVHGDDAVATRAKFCSAIREVLSCGAIHASQCSDFLTDMLAQYIGHMLGTQSALSNVNAEAIAHMLDKKLCFLCKDDGEALKIVMATMLDGNKRKKMRAYTQDSKRNEIYQTCEAAKSAPVGTKVDKDYVKKLVASDPCAAQPFASCVAEDMHKSVNPGVELNVIGVMANLTFTEALNCSGIHLPASFDMSKCPNTIDDAYHASGAHHAHHEHHRRRRAASPAAGESCDSAKVLADTAQCFITSDAGNKLTGSEGLDIQNGIKNIKWQKVVDAAKKNPGNITKIREVIYEGKLEKAAGLRMDIAMWMDDAVYGDNSAAVLNDACAGLKAALNCMSNLRPCKGRYDRLLSNALHSMSGDYHPPAVNVTGFAKLFDKEVCYLCSGDKESLKAVFKTILDGNKREQLKALIYNDTARIAAYKDCPAASENGRTPDQITKEFMMQLAQTDVCATYPFAKCLADDIHQISNPDATTSYMADLSAIMFRQLWGCADVQAPTSGGFNMEQCQTALAAGADS